MENPSVPIQFRGGFDSITYFFLFSIAGKEEAYCHYYWWWWGLQILKPFEEEEDSRRHPSP